jgi:hypothetical protein
MAEDVTNVLTCGGGGGVNDVVTDVGILVVLQHHPVVHNNFASSLQHSDGVQTSEV